MIKSNTAFTHAGLTTRYRKDNLYKNIFVLLSSRNIWFVKRIERLLHIAGMKFEFSNLEIRFHKSQVSFLVVKTVKCKRGISQNKDWQSGSATTYRSDGNRSCKLQGTNHVSVNGDTYVKTRLRHKNLP